MAPGRIFYNYNLNIKIFYIKTIIEKMIEIERKKDV